MSRLEGHDDTVVPTATLAYAQGSGAVPQVDIRPYALLLPNLAAVAVLFMPIAGDDTPLEPIVSYARSLMGGGGRSDIWEAFITGPFLLAIPLAVWTIRLSVQPRVTRRESIVAWSMAVSALTMTVLAAGFASSLIIFHHEMFVPAVAVCFLVLTLTLLAIWRLRDLKFAYPAALLAMTGVYAANTMLTILVVLSHHEMHGGIILGCIVAAAQVVASLYLIRRWRERIPAARD